MDELAGLQGVYFDGIFFTEDPAAGSRLSAQLLRVEISRQNSNLQQVKQRLAKKVREAGGNSLVGFRYGQRSHSIFAQVLTFKWDTESWYGEGYAARVGDRTHRRVDESDGPSAGGSSAHR
jgi:hypothetical protein